MAAHAAERIDISMAFAGRVERLADSHSSLGFSAEESVGCETRQVIEKQFAAVDDHDAADLERKHYSAAVCCRSIVLD